MDTCKLSCWDSAATLAPQPAAGDSLKFYYYYCYYDQGFKLAKIFKGHLSPLCLVFEGPLNLSGAKIWAIDLQILTALNIFKCLNKIRYFVNIYTHNHLSMQIVFRKMHDLFRIHAVQGHFTETSHYDGDDADGNRQLTLPWACCHLKICGPLARGPALF